ncbi:hypothetical protein [Coprobacter tertius]|uniref:Phosphate-selective porin n=1 Tax=Coprobacter tertius TaxID=2944915 RepID=A0ABT1MIS8_9BACT|nr:hypothetical protein [Coprobacter tertius]MCP9612284.1 hypothetical protein [Coprobacter tertius]
MKYLKLILIVLLLNSFWAGATESKELPRFKLGGALRFNYNFSDWNQGHRKRGGDFGYDVLRFRLTGSYKKFMLDADFRFYSKDYGGPMLKYGWIGYRFNPEHQLQLGLTGVPFGIQPYSAHNFFFQISYYIGLEDDSDMGIKYLYTGEHWEYTLAFFKNAEELLFGSKTETSDDRYAYDVAGRNKEINQGNAQAFYKWGDDFRQKVGVSAEFGQLYNLDTERKGTHFAFAVHHELYWKGLSLKTQIATYAMYPCNVSGVSRDTVTMTAYGAPYKVASKANIYTIGIGYTFPVKWGPINSIQVYNDFGWMQKWKKDFNDSFQNVTGCMIAAGPVYTYIDYALGKHQAWLGPDWEGFGPGYGSNSWHARFNVNIGYYF